jgi:hypothetical protein
MGDYLSNLVDRAFGAQPVVQPQVASLFAPAPYTQGALAAAGFGTAASAEPPTVDEPAGWEAGRLRINALAAQPPAAPTDALLATPAPAVVTVAAVPAQVHTHATARPRTVVERVPNAAQPATLSSARSTSAWSTGEAQQQPFATERSVSGLPGQRSTLPVLSAPSAEPSLQEADLPVEPPQAVQRARSPVITQRPAERRRAPSWAATQEQSPIPDDHEQATPTSKPVRDSRTEAALDQKRLATIRPAPRPDATQSTSKLAEAEATVETTINPLLARPRPAEPRLSQPEAKLISTGDVHTAVTEADSPAPPVYSSQAAERTILRPANPAGALEWSDIGQSVVPTAQAVQPQLPARPVERAGPPWPQERTPPTEPTIQVTIGRVEVRATPSAPVATARKPTAPVMSLDEYLRSRTGGRP